MIDFGLVGLLRPLGTHEFDPVSRRRNSPRIARRYLNSAFRRCYHCPNHYLPIFQTDIELIGRTDRRDGVPRNFDLAREFRLKKKFLRIRSNDRTGKPVAIFHGDLVCRETH